jgi:hypothetical protein
MTTGTADQRQRTLGGTEAPVELAAEGGAYARAHQHVSQTVTLYLALLPH